MKILLFMCTFLCVFMMKVHAQEMYEIPLETSIQNADVIIEGKVISSESEWNENRDFIYTIHKIEVHKILKGEPKTDVISLKTRGGRVGDALILVTHELAPKIGETGIFMLKNLPQKNQFRTYASQQGFLRYQGHQAIAPFKNLDLKSVWTYIVQTTGEPIRLIKNSLSQTTDNQRIEAPEITAFSPTTIPAGTQSILTITGSGFGAKTNSSNVFFPFSNDGGTSLRGSNAYILSWTDTRIEIYVPDFAGTGSFVVQNADGQQVKSNSDLIIPYSITEINDQTDGKFKMPKLVNANSAGGYSIAFSSSMDEKSGVIEAFDRALQTWKCAKKINFQTVSERQNITIAFRDNLNVISFDKTNQLPEGVLGEATSYYSGCSVNNSAGAWSLVEFDIIFSSDVDWYFGTELPSSSQSDFETTALHEISHTVQINHLIDPTDVMHYSFKAGFMRRDLSPVNQAAADYVLRLSAQANSCGGVPMELLTNCEENVPKIIPKAFFVIDKTQLCVGDSLFLTDKSEHTTSRIWTFEGGNPGTSGEVSQAVTYPQAGHFQVTLTAISEGGKDTVNTASFITVFDFPTVNLGEDITTCADEEIILKPQNTSADLAYEWSDGSQSETLKVTQSGLYILTVIRNGCRASDQVQVTLNPVPEAGWSFEADAENPQKVQFINEAKNAPSLSWDFGDGRTSTEFNPVHEYRQAGDYEVTQTIINVCGTARKTQTITVAPNPLPTGIEQTLENEIVMYPNPSEGKIILQGKLVEKSIIPKVYNAYGQEVRIKFRPTKNQLELDLSQNPKGIYFVVIEQNSQKWIRSISIH